MSTSNLQTVAPPDYPLTDNGRKRLLYILVAFVGTIVFIITYSSLSNYSIVHYVTPTVVNVSLVYLLLQLSMVSVI